MNCGICGKETDKITYLFGVKVWLCELCKTLGSQLQPSPKKKSPTPAHLRDMQRRYIRPDGSVGRERDKYWKSTMKEKFGRNVD